jgi:hypothetical protein
MRTIRRLEERRDDPLFDRVLLDLERGGEEDASGDGAEGAAQTGAPAIALMPEAEVTREARRYLRRLCEPGSFLLVANGSEKAGVFCSANGHRKPIAMFAVSLAAEFLRRDWIRIERRGHATVRYIVTEAGRAFLRRALAEETERRIARNGLAGEGVGAPGMGEAPSPFAAQHALPGTRVIVEGGEAIEARVNLGESPIGWLARRRGPNGDPFLTPAEVEAGERLRCDFERAQLGPSVAQDWRKFLVPGDRYSGTPRNDGPGDGAMAARDRVTAALGLLGPGLSDVALRVCCFIEGLEACERRLGWSARSGKVVLKLALQRLAEHYGIRDHRH